MNKKIKKLILISVFTAILCIISPISIYIGPIPLSLSLFIILIVNSIFNKFEGVVITVLYILIGAIGLPVFAGGMAGFQVIVGPTGGYIIGYLLCSLIVSLMTNLNNKSNTILIFSYIIGVILCYLCGVTYYIYLFDSTLKDAIMLCVYPFLIVDTIKISIAFIVSIILKNKL